MIGLGWSPGEPLGKNKNGLLKPIQASGQLGRAGIEYIMIV